MDQPLARPVRAGQARHMEYRPFFARFPTADAPVNRRANRIACANDLTVRWLFIAEPPDRC